MPHSIIIFALTMKCSLESLKAENMLYLPTFLLFPLFLFCDVSRTPFIKFFLFRKFMVAIPWGQVFCQQIPFLYLRISWFPFHFWRMLSLDTEFWLDSLLALEKRATPWLLIINPGYFPTGVVLISSFIFLSCLVFRSLIVICLGVNFFSFLLFKVCSAS